MLIKINRPNFYVRTNSHTNTTGMASKHIVTLLVAVVVNCGDPDTPENGRRELSSTTFRAAALYSCNDGFSLVGSVLRICTASGEWSGFIPTCKSELTPLHHVTMATL